MSIHDSALADAELATSIEGVICNICTRAPMYATDLVQQAGKLVMKFVKLKEQSGASHLHLAMLQVCLSWRQQVGAFVTASKTSSGWCSESLVRFLVISAELVPVPVCFDVSVSAGILIMIMTVCISTHKEMNSASCMASPVLCKE